MSNQNPSQKSSPYGEVKPKGIAPIPKKSRTKGTKPRRSRSLKEKMAISMFLTAFVLMPLAWLAALKGEFVPILIAILVMAAGAISAAAARKGRYADATKVEMIAIITGGLLLTLTDPQFIDPGLAIIILSAVHLAIAGVHKSGKNIWFTLSAMALFSGISITGWLPGLIATGTIVGWTGAIYCTMIVTLQTYSAVRLYQLGRDRDRAHNAAVRHLAEHMGDGYVRFTPDAELLFASEHTEDLLGAPRYELLGQGLLERVHILDRPLFLKCLSDSIHSSKNEIIDVRMRRDNANSPTIALQYVWIEIFFSPIVNKGVSKEKWEIVALLRDVTDRKDHEFELIEARKSAEEASKSKSAFLATMGHELRTPLNAIVGFSEMMSSGIGGVIQPAHEEYVQLIHESGHHLLEVVNMLLDMSKIEAGKFELQLNSFEAVDLVRPCVKMIEADATRKNVTMVTNLNSQLPVIVGDERACRQILINLLSNAVKFSNPGSEVAISVKRQGQKLSISVKDTGIGMSKEASQRIGEAFFQVHDSLSRQYEGTGLGMSIVKGLVALHQGSLKIQSEIGQGTTITVLLPLDGPKNKFIEPQIVTPLIKKTEKIETGQWPEQKSIAL